MSGHFIYQISGTCKTLYGWHKIEGSEGVTPFRRQISSTVCNMLLQLATLKFVGQQIAYRGGNTGNKSFQLAKQQCWVTSCKEMLLVLIDPKVLVH